MSNGVCLLFLSIIFLLDVKALELDEIILKSIIPSVGSKCQSNYASSATNITSKTTLIHQKSPSYWNAMADPFEKDLFLAEMSHKNDIDDRQSWTIRIGKGANIYSFRGKYGEAIPPQYHENAVFIDEVTQSVSVNQEKNRNSGKPYFIHQAGIYTKDGDFTPKKNPFFSPNIAKYCGGNECLSGSWGQQAHVPTFHSSDVLYFNGYRDCGDGVLELTSVIHNAADDLDDGDEVSYLNVPWGGVRRSNLRDILISNADGTLEHNYPMPSFFDTQITDMRETGGFTTFTENIKASEEAFASSAFTMPNVDGQNLNLVVASGLTVDDPVKSEQWNMPCFRTNIEKTVIIKTGCQFCSLYLTNEEGYRFFVPEIIHWSWAGEYIYFCGPLRDPSDRQIREDADAWKLNNHLTIGTKITVFFANEGKPEEENSALTFVHGLDDFITNQWASSRLRYGWAGGARRDYTVYTGNVRAAINPGDTYVYQQYIISGALTDVVNVAPLWVDEVYEDLYSLGEMSGTSIRLYSNDEKTFGATVDINSSCSQGQRRCEGMSVPHFGMKPLFAISCGSKRYVGSDRYYFAPSRSSGADIIRPYLCDDEDLSVKLEWKLLGFFVEGSCNFLRSARYDDSFCVIETPSTRPSTISSSEPSNIVTQLPSFSNTNMPFKNHTIMPSIDPSVQPTFVPSTNPISSSSVYPASNNLSSSSNSVHHSDQLALANPSIFPSFAQSMQLPVDYTIAPSVVNGKYASNAPTSDFNNDFTNKPFIFSSNITDYPSIPPSVISLDKPAVSVPRMHSSTPSTSLSPGSFNPSQDKLSEITLSPQINQTSSTTDDLTSILPENDGNSSLSKSPLSSRAIYLKFQSSPVYLMVAPMMMGLFLS